MIVSAAIKRDGIVYTGIRHCQIINDMVHNHNCKTPIRGDEQGFIDDEGNFWNRFQARARAKKSGQIDYNFHGVLLSEYLW